jgi:hypothetical protein
MTGDTRRADAGKPRRRWTGTKDRGLLWYHEIWPLRVNRAVYPVILKYLFVVSLEKL